jgi:flagellar biosynthesis chaperone FliJ
MSAQTGTLPVAPVEKQPAATPIPSPAPQQGTPDVIAPKTPDIVQSAGTLHMDNIEKRIADKKDYLSQLDREITKHHEALKNAKAEAERIRQIPQETPAPHVATISEPSVYNGEQFLKEMNENPNAALDRLIARVEAKVQARVPLEVQRTQQVLQLQQAIDVNRNRLPPEHQAVYDARIAECIRTGIGASPDQIAREIMFGPPEVQEQLMALGMQAIRPPTSQPVPEAAKQPFHPMMPGRTPVAPAPRTSNPTNAPVYDLPWKKR